jgi:sulfite reductase beta subunit-like hemoprotein
MNARTPEGAGQYDKDDLAAAYERYRLDGVYRQSGGGSTAMIRVRAPGGRWKSRDLDSVARIAEDSGDGSMHFTTRGDVELYGVPVAGLDEVLSRLHKAGLSSRGACGDTVRNVVACAGSGVCPEEKFDAAELACRISEEFTGTAAFEHLPRKFKISVSGCEKACACPQVQDVGIVAVSPSAGGHEQNLFFDIYLGGGLGRNPMLARKVRRMRHSEDLLLFVRAALECFDELGERRRKQRARMKFLAEALGHEQLLHRIMEKADSKTWGHQI